MKKALVPYSPALCSLASASTIVWLIHQKLELGIPLYCKKKEWEVQRLKPSRATISNRLLAVFRDRPSHVVCCLKRKLMKKQVPKKPGRRNTSDSCITNIFKKNKCFIDKKMKGGGIIRITLGNCETSSRY